MTYNVFGGTLNVAQQISCSQFFWHYHVVSRWTSSMLCCAHILQQIAFWQPETGLSQHISTEQHYFPISSLAFPLFCSVYFSWPTERADVCLSDSFFILVALSEYVVMCDYSCFTSWNLLLLLCALQLAVVLLSVFVQSAFRGILDGPGSWKV